MKKTVFFFLFISLFANAYCQKKNKSNYISFSAGMNFPVAGYGATDLQNSASGFAKPAEYISFAWSKLVSDKIGYTIMLSGQRNPIDTKAMADEFSHTPVSGGIFTTTTPGNVPNNGTTYPNWNFKKTSWLLASLQAGLYGEFPFPSSNISVITRLTAGAMYAKLPEQNGQSMTDTSFVNIYQSKGSAFGFAYSLGTGLKYKIDSKMCVLLNINYWASADLTFNDVKTVITQQKSDVLGGSIQQAQYTGSASQAFQSTSVSLGIGIQL